MAVRSRSDSQSCEASGTSGFSVQMLDENRCILTEQFLAAVLGGERGKRSVGKLIVKNREKPKIGLNFQ